MDVYWASVIFQGLPRWLSGKESTRNAGDWGLIPRCGRSPGEGNGNPLQYSCLGNSTDRGAWRATVHGVAKSRTRLSDWEHTSSFRRYTHGLSAIPQGTPDRKLKFTEVYLVSLRLYVCEPRSWESRSWFTQSPRWPRGVPAAPLVSAPRPAWPCSVWRGSASPVPHPESCHLGHICLSCRPGRTPGLDLHQEHAIIAAGDRPAQRQWPPLPAHPSPVSHAPGLCPCGPQAPLKNLCVWFLFLGAHPQWAQGMAIWLRWSPYPDRFSREAG